MQLRSVAIASAILLIFFIHVSSAFCEQVTPEQKNAYLQKVAVESSNPVGELWMITNQFNLNLEQADQNTNFRTYRPQFNYDFQPVLKFDLNDDWRFLSRPVIPVYYSPSPRDRTAVDYLFGLGDIELKGVVSPNAKGPGFKWGAGPSAVFPTATDTRLGNGKWQLGGALTALYTNDKLVVGMFPEHWWSVAGDPRRPDVSLTKVQYFFWYSVFPTWQVGMAPTATIDWLQPKSENAVTLPIGLGVSKTVLLGKIPVKFSAEVDYAVVRPRSLPGDAWTIKFSIIPIIPALF